MLDPNNLLQNPEDVNKILDHDSLVRKIKDEVMAAYQQYNVKISHMAADAPLDILCIPQKTKKILELNGLNRVYDLIDLDFTKIEGLSDRSRAHLTSCRDKFVAML